MSFDGKAFGAEIVGVVKGYLSKELAPLVARLDALEKRVDGLPAPLDLSSDLAEVKAAVGAIVIPEIPPAPELPDIGKMVDDAIKAQMAVDDLEQSLEELVKFAVDAIPRPQDGKSVTVDDVAPMIAAEIEKRVAAIPAPKDGEPGKDGLGIKEMFRAEGGRLIAVMGDGTTRDLGVFVGKDAEPAQPGRDGLGFDDLDVTYDGEKTVTLTFSRGDVVKTFPIVMPVVIDRGVYRDSTEYKAGDGVTWAGSFWIARKDTQAKPDASDDWRLSVKRGRDGKPGEARALAEKQPVRVGTPMRKGF